MHFAQINFWFTWDKTVAIASNGAFKWWFELKTQRYRVNWELRTERQDISTEIFRQLNLATVDWTTCLHVYELLWRWKSMTNLPSTFFISSDIYIYLMSKLIWCDAPQRRCRLNQNVRQFISGQFGEISIKTDIFALQANLMRCEEQQKCLCVCVCSVCIVCVWCMQSTE